MNTIKFAPYNDFVTEQHNVETATVSNVKVFDKDLLVYNPCNFNVFITNLCQNRCYFCINARNDTTHVDDETYFHNLEKILQNKGDLHLEATITGGEPTLAASRMVETIRLLKKFGVNERTVSTTGIGLLNKYENKTILQHLIENDYTHNISISRMSIDEDTNNEVLHGKNITNETLRKIAFICDTNGVQLRTSTNILAGYVDNYQKMLDFVDFQHGLGINSCLFREVIPKLPKNLFSITFLKQAFRNDENSVFLKVVDGVFYNIELYMYKSPKTKQEYIVKLYQGKEPGCIGSLSYNQGKLRIGFNGDILYGN